jgi:hypothetical protein
MGVFATNEDESLVFKFSIPLLVRIAEASFHMGDTL